MGWTRWIVVATALAAVCPATAAVAARTTVPPAGAVFTGRTAQGLAVRLNREREQRRAFRYQARLRCSDGSTFTDDPFTDIVRLRGRRFSLDRWTDHHAVHAVLAGVVDGRRAHGTLRITERYSEVPDAEGNTPLDANGAILCDSGPVAWHARRARRPS